MSESKEVRLLLGERAITMGPEDTVLSALENAGLDVASGCRAGTCCKCMLQAESPPVASQRNLRSTLQAQGYFLACQAKPTEDLRLLGAEAPTPIAVVVEAKSIVSPDVVQLFLRPAQELSFRPGQYLDVIHPQGETRSYSIASLPQTGLLELHVRRVREGFVSGWLHELQAGDSFEIRGSFGQCFYLADDIERPLLLVGAGTGLAPLLGIARDAVSQGHQGRILLVHGGLNPSRLYLRNELRSLADAHPNLEVQHCVLQGGTDAEHEGALDKVALSLAGNLKSTRTFLCGDPGIVKMLQRSLFLAGAASSEILADPFLPAGPLRA